MSEEFTDFEIELDLSEQEAWGGAYELAPPGYYDLTVVGFVQKNAKSSGNPMIAVTFEIASGEFQGRKVFNNYSLSPKALGRIKKLMLACRTELSRIIASQFMGQTIRGEVIHTTGEGSVDATGNALEPKTFANVINEEPIEEVEVAPTPAKNKPPIVEASQVASTVKPAATKGNATRRA